MTIPTKWLLVASGLLGAMVTIVGVVLLVAPPLAAQMYGLPRADEPVWQHVAGVRELSMGVLILSLVWTKQLRALGYLMLALSPIPLGDFILALRHDAGIVALQHFPGIPGMIVIGVLLLRRHATSPG